MKKVENHRLKGNVLEFAKKIFLEKKVLLKANLIFCSMSFVLKKKIFLDGGNGFQKIVRFMFV